MKRKTHTIEGNSVFQDNGCFGIAKGDEKPPPFDDMGGMTRHFFECEEGNRWSECEWGNDKEFWQGKHISKDGSYCFFSGCLEHNHKIKLVESLAGHSEECEQFEKDWFHSVYKGKKGKQKAYKNNIKNLFNT